MLDSFEKTIIENTFDYINNLLMIRRLKPTTLRAAGIQQTIKRQYQEILKKLFVLRANSIHFPKKQFEAKK